MRYARLFAFLLATCFGILFITNSSAQEFSPDKIMAFADHLYEQADYYRAITEYERLIFFFPKHPLSKKAEYQIAMSYYKGEKYDQAIHRFRAIAHQYRAEESGRRSLLMLSDSYYQKRDYTQALNTLELFLELYPDDSQSDTARFKKGWSYLKLGKGDQAAEEFQNIPRGSSLRDQAAALAEESKNYREIPRKSPILAAGFSAVIPGAGQLYIGRPKDAAAAFLLNGLFIWGAAEAFRHDNDVTGGILLFFESGWYLGNIYNALSGAHKYNRRAEQEFLDNLQTRYGISYRRHERDGNMLALTIRF